MLREHKRRVVNYVEETITESILDLGTSVMVMQTTCRTPGCVPLETAIAIVFPRIDKGELIPGIKESDGGTFKTKILMPLSQVTKDDVLDALPPGFEGGRKTWEKTCLQMRDLVFGRIGGLVGSGTGDGEVEDRRVLAEYLRMALDDYLDRDCVAPILDQPFQKLEDVKDDKDSVHMQENGDETSEVLVVKGSLEGSGNFVIRRKDEKEEDDATTTVTSTGTTRTSVVVSQSQGTNVPAINQSGSLTHTSLSSTSTTPYGNGNATVHNATTTRNESAMDWRRRQNMTQSLQLGQSSDNILQRLSEREHAPGVRSPGCPCCDPENLGNIVDGMML